MAKEKTVVNEIDGFFILANYKAMTLEQLAVKTKIKKENIRKYIDERIDTKTTTDIISPEQLALKQQKKAFDLMQRPEDKTSGRSLGVTIMTPTASNVGDDAFDVSKGSNRARPDTTSYVHKIR